MDTMDAKKAKVQELHAQGWGYQKISNELDIPRTTVRRILGKAGDSNSGIIRPIERNAEIYISLIRLDGDTQSRVTVDRDTVTDYAVAMTDGVEFPVITVYQDDLGAYWLADGFHRVLASKDAGYLTVKADVYKGTRRDAQLHAMSANANHGLRRTNADKRKAVDMALDDEEWSELPNTRIAEICAVAESFVRKIKAERESHKASEAYEQAQAATVGQKSYWGGVIEEPKKAAKEYKPVEELRMANEDTLQTFRSWESIDLPPQTGTVTSYNHWGRTLVNRDQGTVTFYPNSPVLFNSKDELKSFIDALEAHYSVWDDGDKD